MYHQLAPNYIYNTSRHFSVFNKDGIIYKFALEILSIVP